MNAYLDASFLVSLYSADVNSAAAARTMQHSDGTFLVTGLAELEVVNAFELRIFRREISVLQAETSARYFLADLQAGLFKLCALPKKSFPHAHDISRRTTAKIRNTQCGSVARRGGA